MKRFLVIGGLIMAASLVPVKAMAATFSQLVVYGDSLSDLGRAAAATNSLPAESKFPAYADGGGRFSNGSIWVEYLATRLDVAANSNTNFAIGGATTGTVNIGQPLSPSFIGIQTQVANNSIGDPAALYVIWGGANDYIFGGITNPAIPVGNLTGEINTLISRGATNILIPNLPNLGALPSTRNLGSTAIGLNNLTAVHNAGLATAIDNLSSANPTVNLRLLDVNSLVNQVAANPSSFGFTNVSDGCLLVGCNTATTDLSNNFLFWDDLHPTTAAHQLIGDLAFQTVSPTAVPEPMTLIGSLMAFSSALALKRKLKSANVAAKERVETN
jgi:phospholipase/lecithinase/hemolysin